MASRMLCSFLFRVLYCWSCSAATLLIRYLSFCFDLNFHPSRRDFFLSGSSPYLHLLYVGQDGILPLTHCTAHDTHSNVKANASECPCHDARLNRRIYLTMIRQNLNTGASLVDLGQHLTHWHWRRHTTHHKRWPWPCRLRYDARFHPFRSLENIARNHSICICTVVRANTLPSHPVTQNELPDQELMVSMTIRKNAANELMWKCDDATSLAIC